MHAIDWAVLPVYLVGITLLGAWAARRVKSSGDFFMPRRFGKAMMITFAFGTGTSSDQAVTVASKTVSQWRLGDLVAVGLAARDPVLLAAGPDLPPPARDHDRRRLRAAVRPQRRSAVMRSSASLAWR